MGLELEAWGVWVSRARADGVANERVATCQLHHVIVVVVVVIVFWGRGASERGGDFVTITIGRAVAAI